MVLWLGAVTIQLAATHCTASVRRQRTGGGGDVRPKLAAIANPA